MRVLLLPPTRRDADALQKVFAEENIPCDFCPDMKALCEEMRKPTGVVLVAEEALTGHAADYIDQVQQQPVWSDLTTIVLSRSGAESPQLMAVLNRLGNASVIERPVRVTTLLSLVRSALRARERQYQVRAHLIERNELLESERAARSAAEHAGQMKDEFLATLSHELRTPLNAILGWSQVLAMDSRGPADLAEGLKKIERNARAQAQIIDDLLDMSRIASGKIRLRFGEVSVLAAVRAAIDTVRPTADAKGVRIEVVLDSAAAMINGDPDRLQQVFWNLLTNAVKFTARDQRVRITVTRGTSYVTVEIADTGEGIRAEFLPHIFDRFRQADASSTRRHGGLGLGLAIVRQLVELHGGDVTAESAGEGHGATFSVRLPVAVAQQSELAPRGRRTPNTERLVASAEQRGRIRGATVLVVDDEADARALLRRLLEDCGATVSDAGSAADAFRLFADSPPDVLISDIGMPGEDGYSLIRRIRSLDGDRGGRVPAIALTAYARAEDRAHAEEAGFQRHIAKPVESAEIVTVVAALLESIAARSSQTSTT
jgi:signal transduction histidine kinase/ActR/RegA family two-component response regulator